MPPATTSRTELSARALQIGERIDLKGLERDDVISANPLAFRVGEGLAVLFRFGAVVFIGMTPVAEEELLDGLAARVREPLAERESESARLVVRTDANDQHIGNGLIALKAADDERLLLVAEALAVSVALAHDERRIARAYDRIEPMTAALKQGRLGGGRRSELVAEMGEALSLQQRLAGRVDLDDKPDVLWDHPGLERFWARLVDEYDLTSRNRAIGRKLGVIRDAAETIRDMLATRTSHRLEWYIVVLILFEIVLSLSEKLWR
jgi:uncharacterized Rmd1/YagE family protein